MESHNLREILRLNQRGGQMLSLLDLVDANTVDLPVASLLAGAVASGASLLTAARPGNAGKTTVMAALLAFLPPRRRIVTVQDSYLPAGVPAGTCLLAHEIGSGPYFAYLWGDAARRFFEASAAPGVQAASCIHADTVDELRSILCGPSVGLGEETFAGIDLVAFLHLDRTSTGYRRRVCAVYAGTGTAGAASHRRVCRWDETTDTFAVEDVPERWAQASAHAAGFLAEARESGATGYEGLFERWATTATGSGEAADPSPSAR